MTRRPAGRFEAARRSGRLLSVGHELRLSSLWGGVKALIDAGDLGDPQSVERSLREGREVPLG